MTVDPGLELRPNVINVVGTNDSFILRMYLMYVDTSLVPNVALRLDVAIKCRNPLHLFSSVL